MTLRFVPKGERPNHQDGDDEDGQFFPNGQKSNHSTTPRPLWKNTSLPKDACIEKARRRDGKINFDWDPSDDTSSPASVPMAMLPMQNRKRDPLLDEPNKHWSKKGLQEMTSRDWRILREDFDIAVTGSAGQVAHPIRWWRESGGLLDRALVDNLRRLGYDEPRPIQRQAIPVALSGCDFIGLAETGSGKTVAFVLPILEKIVISKRLEQRKISPMALLGPIGLVLAPTRELALQIEQETRKLSQGLNALIIASLIGGHSLTEQSMQLRSGADVIIATPGRLRDCLEQRVLTLHDCACLVLDEADRMIDLNFEDDLEFILEVCKRASPAVQTSMFSATMQPAIERIATRRLRAPYVVIRVGEANAAVDTVQQRLVWARDDQEKCAKLVEIVGYADEPKYRAPIIAFVSQRARVEMLARRLNALGWSTAILYGDKSQTQREAAIEAVRRGRAQVLVATDVAGRGLDIAGVTLVLNYDLPKGIMDYVHRIGRTGRSGLTGDAISLVTPEDAPQFYDLKRLLLNSKASSSSSGTAQALPPEFAHHEATMHRNYQQQPPCSEPKSTSNRRYG